MNTEPLVVPAAVPPTILVVELPTSTVKEVRERETLSVNVWSPTLRPAGIVATAGWEVTALGMPVSIVDLPGMPVTTPRELVCVKNLVFALL